MGDIIIMFCLGLCMHAYSFTLENYNDIVQS